MGSSDHCTNSPDVRQQTLQTITTQKAYSPWADHVRRFKRLLAPAPILGCVGLNQTDQFSPGDYQFHSIEEFALACALGSIAQAQAALLHAGIV